MVTILGSTGFIGSHLVKELSQKRVHFFAPNRDEDLRNKNLGDIIYCIGLTSDFRQKPFETVEAHVCYLMKILKEMNFNSLTYLSSTRVYVNTKDLEVNENSCINIAINQPDDLYNLSKLTGERVCLSSERNVKVARLSNVYGYDFSSQNFIFEVLADIKKYSKIKLYTTLSSAKDYISINQVTSLLLDLATSSCSGIYNIATGNNFSNKDILDLLDIFFNYDYVIDENAKEVIHPTINIDKIKNEFNFRPDNTKIELYNLFKKIKNDSN